MCVMMFAFAFASASASASGSLGKLSRDGAFVGYFEERGLRLVAAKDAGSILVRLRPSVMPRTAAMLAEAVAKPMGADNLNGIWYRNEAVPLPSEGNGPPYGLLQGKMIGITFPKDENDEHVGNGTVCAIPDSDAFLINTMDHEEWKGSFTILGYVPLDDAESWATIRRIIDRKWKLLVHPDYGTHMVRRPEIGALDGHGRDGRSHAVAPSLLSREPLAMSIRMQAMLASRDGGGFVGP